MEQVAYQTITEVGIVEWSQSEVASLESAAGAALGAGLALGVLSAVE